MTNDERDGLFDRSCNLLGGTTSAVGYHTTLPAGTPVHPTRASMGYALDLLAAGSAEGRQRAADIIRAVLPLQECDPAFPYCGVWPWYAEEPLAKMSPPDWNWADFIGAILCEMLVRYPERLPADLRPAAQEALSRAAWCIVRRNVGPGYTNIAIMGGGVTAVAGELLGEPRLSEYGRQRLENFERYTAEQGSFNEYNSPTYTLVALEEIERLGRLTSAPPLQALADRLRRVAWTVIAEHYHPGTGQWAGPCSRAYHDWLPAACAAILAQKTGRSIPTRSGETGRAAAWAHAGPPCPPDLAARFDRQPEPELEIRRRFSKAADERKSVHGTTWMAEDACLGSASHATTWTQARPVLGYWRTPADPAVCLRVRLLKQGRDFATGMLWTDQLGPRLLVALGMVTDRGDWHLFFDRPNDGVYTVEDLRLRVLLQGRGVSGRELGGGRFALAAGDRQAVIHALPESRFDGDHVAWQCGTEDDTAWVDAILYQGPPKPLDPARLVEFVVALGIELGPVSAALAPAAIQTRALDDDTREVTWLTLGGRLRVGTERKPHAHWE